MDVMQAINTRRSVRSYSTRPIPPEILDRLRQALRWAPSAGNLQPWRFIFVSDSALRRKLAGIANDQLWMADAPVTIVGCGLPARSYQRMGGRRTSVDVDLAIALDHLTLAAVAEGLGTCWIGAFDEDRAKQLLKVPPDVQIVAMTPVGFPATADLNHPLDESRRKAPNEIFSTDRYGHP